MEQSNFWVEQSNLWLEQSNWEQSNKEISRSLYLQQQLLITTVAPLSHIKVMSKEEMITNLRLRLLIVKQILFISMLGNV